ncbi:MAG: hypothetical protein IPL99_14465 [Candidatus Competibacteraceae bacterium]|nr:hypothetical protein [Candidatus Competibacteraceae bacterium]
MASAHRQVQADIRIDHHWAGASPRPWITTSTSASGASPVARARRFVAERSRDWRSHVGDLAGPAARSWGRWIDVKSAPGGVCPLNRDPGPYRGQRSIFGGRAVVRKALYMATFHRPPVQSHHQSAFTNGGGPQASNRPRSL